MPSLMVARLLTLACIVIHLQATVAPCVRQKRSPREIQAHQPVLFSHQLLQNYYSGTTGNIQLLAPIPGSQLYIHQKLHVVPNTNLHPAVQHLVAKDNVKIPVISQQNPQKNGNYSHARHTLLPLLIPIQNIVATGNHLIPVHDLSVIPLHRNTIERAQYRSVGRKEENNEERSNRYRNFYGGYGTGLFFGGHGAGHGFYTYGK